jgi:hypothetical protein
MTVKYINNEQELAQLYWKNWTEYNYEKNFTVRADA